MSKDDQQNPADVDRDEAVLDAPEELSDEVLEHISGGTNWGNQNPMSPWDN